MHTRKFVGHRTNWGGEGAGYPFVQLRKCQVVIDPGRKEEIGTHALWKWPYLSPHQKMAIYSLSQ